GRSRGRNRKRICRAVTPAHQTPQEPACTHRHSDGIGISEEMTTSSFPRIQSPPLPQRQAAHQAGRTAIKRFRDRLAKEFRSLRGSNVAAVLAKIAPIVRGWVAYYRTVVSTRVFAALTDYLWKLTYKWACWSHPNKPKCWIIGRYFGKFNKFRNDRWVFGDRD